jgi:hypothetical protein
MEVTDPVIYAISAGLVAGINYIAAVEKRPG